MQKLELNYYRLLGRSGLRVSPLCLGTMTFGTEWGFGSEKKDSERIFSRFLECGGNFIDTADFYTQGTSETYLGEFLKGRREFVVLGTKFTLNTKNGDPNAGGNHRKNIVQSVDASLKRLQTDYIDLYWLHAWEYRTPIDEVMRALDDLVRAGKVLYLGISDAPAWKVAEANTLADFRGWTPFVALQILYNLIDRTVERELVPMANELRLGITPWSPLAAGVLSGKYRSDTPTADPKFDSKRSVAREKLTERNLKIAAEVRTVAEEIGCSPAQVALRWLVNKPGVASPIIGARTLAQLDENIGSLAVMLSDEHLKRLETASRIELGFPHDFLSTEAMKNRITGGTTIA